MLLKNMKILLLIFLTISCSKKAELSKKNNKNSQDSYSSDSSDTISYGDDDFVEPNDAYQDNLSDNEPEVITPEPIDNEATNSETRIQPEVTTTTLPSPVIVSEDIIKKCPKDLIKLSRQIQKDYNLFKSDLSNQDQHIISISKNCNILNKDYPKSVLPCKRLNKTYTLENLGWSECKLMSNYLATQSNDQPSNPSTGENSNQPYASELQSYITGKEHQLSLFESKEKKKLKHLKYLIVKKIFNDFSINEENVKFKKVMIELDEKYQIKKLSYKLKRELFELERFSKDEIKAFFNNLEPKE